MARDTQAVRGDRQHERPHAKLAALRIYEAHVGMSSEEPVVASYTYFKGASVTRAWHACIWGPMGPACGGLLRPALHGRGPGNASQRHLLA